MAWENLDFIARVYPWLDDRRRRVGDALERLGLASRQKQRAGTLSGGWKQRLALAACLLHDPELLLLDEPTNHLDLDGIAWLERLLVEFAGAVIVVTHDRRFLRNVATRILDLDRGRLRSYRSGYDRYLETRDDELRVEAEQAALFDRKLAREEAWVRRGVKARRTRNEGRVRALEALRRERGARREEVARVRAELQEAERSGKHRTKPCRHDGCAAR